MSIKPRSELKTRLQRGSDVVSKKLGEDIYDSLVAEFERLKKEVLLRTGVQRNGNNGSSAPSSGVDTSNFVTLVGEQTVSARKTWKAIQSFQDGIDVEKRFEGETTSGIIDVLAERSAEAAQATTQAIARILTRIYRYSADIDRQGTVSMKRISWAEGDVNSQANGSSLVGNGTASISDASQGCVSFFSIVQSASIARDWVIDAFGRPTDEIVYEPNAFTLLSMGGGVRFRLQAHAQIGGNSYVIGGETAGTLTSFGGISNGAAIDSARLHCALFQAFDKPVDGWRTRLICWDDAGTRFDSGWIAGFNASNIAIESLVYDAGTYGEANGDWVRGQDLSGLDPSQGLWGCGSYFSDILRFAGLTWAEGDALATALTSTLTFSDVEPLTTESENWNAASTQFQVGRIDESDNETIDLEVDISGLVRAPRASVDDLTVRSITNSFWWSITDQGELSLNNPVARFANLGETYLYGKAILRSGFHGLDTEEGISIYGGATNTTAGILLNSVASATPTKGILRSNNTDILSWDETGVSTATLSADTVIADILKAGSSAGLSLQNENAEVVALLGAGPGQGSTFYGQINGTALQLSSLTSTRVVTVGASGILTDDAGLARSQLSGITRYLSLGDGSVAGTVAYIASGPAGQRKIISYQTANVPRWVVGAESDAESGSNNGSAYIIEAQTDAGGVIDKPLSIVRASAGLITLGGTTARAVNLTGALQFSGTTRITNAGAATFASATISNLTSGRVTYATTSGALTDSGALLFDGTSVLSVGTGAASGVVAIDGTSGSASGVALRTGTSSRWSIRRGATSETGSDAGSQFELVARTDAAVEIDYPISIIRASGGLITFGGSTSRPTNFTGAIRVGGTEIVSSSRDATFASLGVNTSAAPATGYILTQYTSTTALGIQATYGAGTVGASIITANSTGYAGADQILFRGRSVATDRFIVYANGDVGFTGEMRIGGTTVITSARAATFASAAVSNLTSGRIVVASTAGLLSDSASLLWDGTNLTVTALVTGTVRASSSSGVLVEANGGTDVALFGAGGGAGSTFYGQINGTAIQMSGDVAGTSLTVRSADNTGVQNATDLGALLWSADDDSAARVRGTAAEIRLLGTGTWNDSVSPSKVVIRMLLGATGLSDALTFDNGAGGVAAAITANFAGAIQVGGTTIVSAARAATFASATISNLTSGRIPTVGTSGLIQDDAGFTYSRTSSIVVSVIVGDGVVASDANVVVRAAAARRRDIVFRTASSNRWTVGVTSTAESGSNAGSNFAIEAFTDAAASIDSPLTIVRASGGLITLGGSSARAVSFTGAIQTSGTTRISNAGAATFTSLTITGATTGHIPYIGAAALVTTDAGFTVTQASGITTILTLGNGSVASTAGMAIRGPAGQRRVIGFDTGTSARWRLIADTTAESGSNAGSTFAIEAYTDAAALIDTPITIVRAASGLITIGGTSRPTNFSGDFRVGGTTFITSAGAASFKDGSNFSILNTADATKKAQFDLSGITTATTRTFTAPDKSGELIVGTLSGSNLTVSPSQSTHTRMDILGGPSCTRIKVDSLASFLDVDGGSGIAQLYGNGSYFFLQSADISALTPIFKFAGAKVAIGTSGGTYDVYLTRASASVLRLSSDGTTGAASLDVRGANFRAVTIRSGSASTGSTDYYVGYSGSGGHTETLPAATGSGRVLIFDHGGSGNWTIDGNAAETIDGAATVILTAGVKLMLIDAASGVWRSI